MNKTSSFSGFSHVLPPVLASSIPTPMRTYVMHSLSSALHPFVAKPKDDNIQMFSLDYVLTFFFFCLVPGNEATCSSHCLYNMLPGVSICTFTSNLWPNINSLSMLLPVSISLLLWKMFAFPSSGNICIDMYAEYDQEFCIVNLLWKMLAYAEYDQDFCIVHKAVQTVTIHKQQSRLVGV